MLYRRGKLGEEAVALRRGVQVAPLTLHHLVAFAHAVNDGRTAKYDPRRAATEVGTLFRRVTKTLSLQTHKRVNEKCVNAQTYKRKHTNA